MRGVTPRAIAFATAALSLALSSAAFASGPPVGGWAEGGVVGAGARYVALPAGHGTLLERLAVRGWQPVRTRYLRSKLGVPMIATDGTPGGLSGDGRTLVLSAPRTSYPQRVSALYVMNTRNLALRRRITLKGDLSFDAISPDGATIYLIQLDPRNLTSYAVRALDTRSGRLFAKPVVDRREPDEAMRGVPFTRATSPDGRYAYTLYAGGEKPFIHALDTMSRSAACIDIPPIPPNDSISLRLSGRRLTVLASGSPISYVDAARRKVSKAEPATPPRHPAAAQSGGGGGGSLLRWLLVAAAAAAAVGGAATLAARRRRAGAARS
jgi:hypothetical protein